MRISTLALAIPTATFANARTAFLALVAEGLLPEGSVPSTGIDDASACRRAVESANAAWQNPRSHGGRSPLKVGVSHAVREIRHPAAVLVERNIKAEWAVLALTVGAGDKPLPAAAFDSAPTVARIVLPASGPATIEGEGYVRDAFLALVAGWKGEALAHDQVRGIVRTFAQRHRLIPGLRGATTNWRAVRDDARCGALLALGAALGKFLPSGCVGVDDMPEASDASISTTATAVACEAERALADLLDDARVAAGLAPGPDKVCKIRRHMPTTGLAAVEAMLAEWAGYGEAMNAALTDARARLAPLAAEIRQRESAVNHALPVGTASLLVEAQPQAEPPAPAASPEAQAEGATDAPTDAPAPKRSNKRGK